MQQSADGNMIHVDVYLDNITLSTIGIDALGIECYSIGVEFSDSGKVMRVFFDDIGDAKEFALIIEMSGKQSVPAKRKK